MKRALKFAPFVACFILLGYLIDWENLLASQEWAQLSPEDQNFSVEFPGEPETWTTFKELSPKDSLSSSNYRLEVDGITYSIKVAKHVSSTPEAQESFNAEEGYDGFRLGLLQQTGGLLVSERDISSKNGTPGREYTISSQETGDLVARIFYTGNVMFALSITSPNGHDVSRERRRIFDSFTIITE